jgi:hypothetical protein
MEVRGDGGESTEKTTTINSIGLTRRKIERCEREGEGKRGDSKRGRSLPKPDDDDEEDDGRAPKQQSNELQ